MKKKKEKDFVILKESEIYTHILERKEGGYDLVITDCMITEFNEKHIIKYMIPFGVMTRSLMSINKTMLCFMKKRNLGEYNG